MKSTEILLNIKTTALLLAALFLGVSSSHALDLAAVEAEWTPPDSVAPISMWGFIADPGSCPVAPVSWDIGPLQAEASGANLTINLRNCLSATTVSLVIPGQSAVLTPVLTAPDGQGRQRVTAFTHEAPADAGATTTAYTWTNLKSGTFLYQSGTNPAKQVHMGLYGALTVGTAPVEVGGEVMVFYSEIDPALHATASSATPLTYKPKYFLINGEAYSSGQAIPAVFGGNSHKKDLLIRFINAGLMSHVPVIQGPYMRIIAEDGNPYPFAKEQYSVHLAAGKTLEALWRPIKEGNYAIYDRSMSLTSNGQPGGGLLTYLNVKLPFPWPLFIPAMSAGKTVAGL